MDLKHLRSFMHVAELGSLSRAGERLNLSQPALSRQIKLLEAALGQALLQRTGRGVRLTTAGLRLERQARAILAAVDRLGAVLDDRAGGLDGHVAIALPPSLGSSVSGPLTAAFRARHPGVSLRILETLSGEIQEGLLSGRLDLGVIYAGTAAVRLHTEKLLRERLDLIVAADDPLADTSAISFGALTDMPLILPGTSHGLRTVLDGYAARYGRLLKTDLEAESLRVQLDLVARGLGRTILPRHTIPPGTSHLHAIEIVDPPLYRESVLAWRRDTPRSPAAEAMAELLIRIARRQPWA